MNEVGRVRPVLDRRLGVALTVVAAAFFAFVSTRLPVPDAGRAVGPLGFVLVAVAVLAAGAAVRWPMSGVALCALAIGGYVARIYPNGPILATGLVAAFLVGWRTDRRRAVTAVLLLEIAVLVGWSVSRHNGQVALFYVGWALAAALLGEAVRSRRRYRDEQDARAASLERSRQVQAQQQLAEQRLQIARDLHDGVAHAMATINVQAAAAARVIDQRPDAARDALAVIARASGSALDELNAVVSVLRDADTPLERAPAPGLAAIAELVVATAGDRLECDLEIRGEPAVGDAVATAAYRIVQESLTNVLRHSDARRAEVTVDAAGSGRLVVQVRDDGRVAAPDSPGGGTGITGMRERAEATGGTLVARRCDAGFVVRAEWADAGRGATA